MKRTVVRYKAKPEKVEENQRLIEKVFQELHAKSPGGVRYLALRLGDGTFVHFAAVDRMLRSPASRRSGLFAAASTSVASSRRRRATRPLSAIIGCWASMKRSDKRDWAIRASPSQGAA